MSDSNRSTETDSGRRDDDRSPGNDALPDARNAMSYGQGAAGLGLTFAASVAAFACLGLWIDRRFGWTPWATLGLTLFGVFSGMTWLVVKAGGTGARRPTGKR